MLVYLGWFYVGPLTRVNDGCELFNVKLIYIYITDDIEHLTIVMDSSLLLVNLGYLRPLLQCYLLPTLGELVF